MSPEPAARRGFLALGDSYSIGEGVAASECWPNQLAAALRSRSIVVDDPQIIACTGWSTDELHCAIDAAGALPNCALASLQIGVNNQYRGRSIENYASEFSVLLDRAITFAGGDSERVFVVSIPDWGATAFGRDSGRDVTLIAREIDAFNAQAMSIAAAHSVVFVEITTLTRAFPSEVTLDGLHPSASQYSRWAERILPVAEHALGAESKWLVENTRTYTDRRSDF